MDALIISQVMTLGKGTTGLGAGTVGPDGGLYTSQSQTGLPNSGYGAIAGGTRPTDTDNDGMPDSWESATGSNVSTNDAMTKAADGYALIEHYVNWLAVPHATSAAGASVDVDLSAWATGFSARVADLHRVGRADRHRHAAGGRPHRALPAHGGLPRRRVVLVQGDRLGQHRVHGRGPGSRRAVPRRAPRHLTRQRMT